MGKNLRKILAFIVSLSILATFCTVPLTASAAPPAGETYDDYDVITYSDLRNYDTLQPLPEGGYTFPTEKGDFTFKYDATSASHSAIYKMRLIVGDENYFQIHASSYGGTNNFAYRMNGSKWQQRNPSMETNIGYTINAGDSIDFEVARLLVATGENAGKYYTYFKANGELIFEKYAAADDSNTTGYLLDQLYFNKHSNIAGWKVMDSPEPEPETFDNYDEVYYSDLLVNGNPVESSRSGSAQTYTYNKTSDSGSVILKMRYIPASGSTTEGQISFDKRGSNNAINYMFGVQIYKQTEEYPNGRIWLRPGYGPSVAFTEPLVSGNNYDIEFARLKVITGPNTGKYYMYFKMNGVLIGESYVAADVVDGEGNYISNPSSTACQISNEIHITFWGGGGATITNPAYTETYEAYDEVNFDDLYEGGASVAGTVKDGSHTYTYNATSPSYSSIIKYRWTAGGTELKFTQFLDDWVYPFCFAAKTPNQDNFGATAGPNGSWHLVPSNAGLKVDMDAPIVYGAPYDIEFARLKVATGPNTGKYYVYAKVNGEMINSYYYDGVSDGTYDKGTALSNKIIISSPSGNKFSDARGGLVHIHNISGEWSNDADNHWHACSGCEEKFDSAAHTASDWIIDVEATTAAAGHRHKECTVCGKVLEEEDIPMLPATPKMLHVDTTAGYATYMWRPFETENLLKPSTKYRVSFIWEGIENADLSFDHMFYANYYNGTKWTELLFRLDGETSDVCATDITINTTNLAHGQLVTVDFTTPADCADGGSICFVFGDSSWAFGGMRMAFNLADFRFYTRDDSDNLTEIPTTDVGANQILGEFTKTLAETTPGQVCERGGKYARKGYLTFENIPDGYFDLPLCAHANTTEVPAVASTCHTHGHAAYTVCDDCGEIITGSDEELPLDPNNHDGETEVRGFVPSSCTATGYTGDTYCLGCGEIIERGTVIPQLGHTTGEWYTDENNHWHICTECHGIVDSAAHTFDSGVVTKPTCTAGGYTTYTCTACGYSYTANETPAAGHTGGTATCHSKAKCTACGEEYGEFDANNHDGETEVRGAVAVSCTAAGYTGDTYCLGCGAKIADGRVIPALGHDYVPVVTAPTCTEGGYTTYTCSHCNDSYVADETAATGHKSGEWVSDANSHWHVCSECSAILDTAAHTPSGWILDKAATTEEAGLKHKVCTVCGAKVVEEVIAKIEMPDIQPGEGVPEIVVESKTAKAGDTVDITIAIKNNPGISSMKLLVTYGAGLTLKSPVVYNICSEDDPDMPNTMQPESYASPVMLNWISPLAETTGDVVYATLTFEVAADAEGDQDITIFYNPKDVFNANEENVAFAVTNGKVTVQSYIPGDINGDNEVDNKDLIRLFQYLSEWGVEIF